MAVAPAGYNYATGAGIQSFPAAVILSIIYALLFVAFSFKSFTRPTYVFFMMTFFCLIRLVAFILRALLADVPSDGQNLDFFIAYQIIYNVGFFGILYSAYTLVLDRVSFAKNPPRGPISALLRRRFLFRLALTAAVSIGITGSIQAISGTQQSTIDTGNTLRRVALYIFLVCSALVLLQALILARVESSEEGYRHFASGFGGRYGLYVLIVISVLLVTREAFFTATFSNSDVQNNEHFWYPFSALTELLAVLLFMIPDLVPSRSEIPQNSEWA
ncbi:hypothetical protein SCLCIDRAFT_1221469 [Scleroderma citrinum Foug A]|uniref:DUF7702 domain-containing protein n=1 Tax=Scleroderma citrinum Foug A TaxID=1036808 RepID=A0A0C2ZR37_9AGAM|nr:hypothetical protein SCLCIDRAFT_1221469 [Scleroderma citrinum Foug A]